MVDDGLCVQVRRISSRPLKGLGHCCGEWICSGAAWGVSVSHSKRHLENPNYAGRAFLMVVIVLVLVFIALYWSIVLYARPKFFIAPHLRDQRGVLAEKRTKRTRREC